MALALSISSACSIGGDDPQDKRVSPDTALTEQCESVPEGARRDVVVADDGTRLGAAVLGRDDAAVGAVINYGATGTLCEWLGVADRLAQQADAKVMVLDRRGIASSEGEEDVDSAPGDVAAAGTWLRDGGSSDVMLIGSSLGTNGALIASLGDSADTAAPGALPPSPARLEPCGVVVISPTLSAKTAASLAGGSLPARIWVTWEKSNSVAAQGADTVVQSARGRRTIAPRTLPVDTSDHSIGLVEKHADVQRFLVDAVRSCGAPPARPAVESKQPAANTPASKKTAT